MRRLTLTRLGQLGAVLGLASLGGFMAIPLATADGPIPGLTTPTAVTVTVPTVTLPTGTTVLGGTTVTVTAPATTVPFTNPSTTVTTTQTVTQSASESGSPSSGQNSQQNAATASKTEIGLPNGTVSVSAGSVHGSTRLLLDRLTYSPHLLRQPGKLNVHLRVRDSIGHVVREALVSVRSNRGSAGSITTSKKDGTATLRLAISRAALGRKGPLILTIRAASATISTQRTLRVAVKR